MAVRYEKATCLIRNSQMPVALCMCSEAAPGIVVSCRNWCAYVVSRSVSCVVEDGVDTYVKPDYQPCAWGQLHCPRTLT